VPAGEMGNKTQQLRVLFCLTPGRRSDAGEGKEELDVKRMVRTGRATAMLLCMTHILPSSRGGALSRLVSFLGR